MDRDYENEPIGDQDREAGHYAAREARAGRASGDTSREAFGKQLRHIARHNRRYLKRKLGRE